MRFLTACVCRLLAPALAGVKAQIKKSLKTSSFYSIICVCAVCATSANILQRERKSNKKRAKKHAKNTMPWKLKQTSKKHRFGSQNASKNRPRRPPGAPWPPPARDFRPKSSPKRSWRALGRNKTSFHAAKTAQSHFLTFFFSKMGPKKGVSDLRRPASPPHTPPN